MEIPEGRVQQAKECLYMQLRLQKNFQGDGVVFPALGEIAFLDFTTDQDQHLGYE